jgi:hypothetical protein
MSEFFYTVLYPPDQNMHAANREQMMSNQAMAMNKNNRSGIDVKCVQQKKDISSKGGGSNGVSPHKLTLFADPAFNKNPPSRGG